MKFLAATAFFSFCIFSQAHAHGAIAVGDKDAKATDNSTEVHSFATDHPNSESAKVAALDKCNESGLKFCHIASWFDQCGAYSRSATNSGTGTGTSKEEASANALGSCGKDCKVVDVQCDSVRNDQEHQGAKT